MYFHQQFDVKKKTAKHHFGAAESKLRAMKVGNSLWNRKKRKGHSKINEQIKINLFAWITCHSQFVQSLISNDCLKFMLYYQIEPQLVSKCFTLDVCCITA